MKTVISLILVFLTISAYAEKPNVVLLTSLRTPKIWYHSKDWRVEPVLRQIFWDRFKTAGYNIVFKDEADQETLRNELLNPKNIAVFWVSHSKESQNLTDGIKSDSAIVDYYGNDVRDIFKNVHPNMKYLGLIGCQAKSIIKDFREEGAFDGNPDLKIFSFEKKIDARIGLKRAIKKLGNSLGFVKRRKRRVAGSRIPRYVGKPQVYSTPEVLKDFYSNKQCLVKDNYYPITVTRTLRKDAPSAAIKLSDHIYDIFPAGKAGETQTREILIPTTRIVKKIDLKLILDSNKFGSIDRIYLGELSFQMSWDGTYKLFAKRDGTPLGMTRNLYRYKGALPSDQDTISAQSYSCLKD